MPLSEVRQQFRYFFLPVREQNNILLASTVFRAFVHNATQCAHVREKIREQKENDGLNALREENAALREQLAHTEQLLAFECKRSQSAESHFHAYERRCADLCNALTVKSIRYEEAALRRSILAKRWRAVRSKAACCISKLPQWNSSLQRWRDEALYRWVFCALLREVKVRNAYEIKALRAVNAEQAAAAEALAAEIHELRDQLAASEVLAEKRRWRIEELEIELKETWECWRLASEDAASQNIDSRNALHLCRRLARRVWQCASSKVMADRSWRRKVRDMAVLNIVAEQHNASLSALWAWRMSSTAERLATEIKARKLAEDRIYAAELRMKEAREAAKAAEAQAVEAKSFCSEAQKDRTNALLRLEKCTKELHMPATFLCLRCEKDVCSQQRSTKIKTVTQPGLDEAREFLKEKRHFLNIEKSPRDSGHTPDTELWEIKTVEHLSKMTEESQGLNTLMEDSKRPVAWSLEEAMKEVFAAPIEKVLAPKPRSNARSGQQPPALRLAQQRPLRPDDLKYRPNAG